MKRSMAVLVLGAALVACGGSGSNTGGPGNPNPGGGGNPSIGGTYRGTISGTQAGRSFSDSVTFTLGRFSLLRASPGR